MLFQQAHPVLEGDPPRDGHQHCGRHRTTLEPPCRLASDLEGRGGLDPRQADASSQLRHGPASQPLCMRLAPELGINAEYRRRCGLQSLRTRRPQRRAISGRDLLAGKPDYSQRGRQPEIRQDVSEAQR